MEGGNFHTTKVKGPTLKIVYDYLRDNHGVSITDIAEGTALSRTGVVAACKILEERGLVSEGVCHKVLKSGGMSEKLVTSYYVD